MQKSFFFALITIVMLLDINNTYAEEIQLRNGSFEDTTDEWSPNNSNVSLVRTAEHVHEGSHSAQLTNISSTSYGIEQTIQDINSNMSYRISSFIKIIDPPPSKAFIRIAWYSTEDASGSQLKTTDSQIYSSTIDWSELSLLTVPPIEAKSAKIRLLTSNGTAYFDDVSIKEEVTTPSPSTFVNPTPLHNSTSAPTLSSGLRNIFISEVMVYPPTGQKEWIELYNDNAHAVDLNNWYIDDREGSGASPKKISLSIPAKGYGTVEVSSVWNNDTDEVRLLDQEQSEVDTFDYDISKKGISWGKTNQYNNVFCLQNPTKNNANSTCINEVLPVTPVAESTISNTKTPTTQQIQSTISKRIKPSPSSIVELSKKKEKDENEKEEEILGTTISIAPPSKGALIRSLMIVSISYSFISITSISMKIRQRFATL